MKPLIDYIVNESSNKPFGKMDVKVKYGNLGDLVKILDNYEYAHRQKHSEGNNTDTILIDLAGNFNNQARKGRTAPSKTYSLLIEYTPTSSKRIKQEDIVSVIAVIYNHYGGTYYETSKNIKDTNDIPLKVD